MQQACYTIPVESGTGGWVVVKSMLYWVNSGEAGSSMKNIFNNLNRLTLQATVVAAVLGALAGVVGLVPEAAAQPNQPPQLFWRLDAPHVNQDEESQYFYDWTWIGDQDGDGTDELLICQEPLLRGHGRPDSVYLNRVELYLGGREEMAQEPDFIFEAENSLETFGRVVTYLGVLTARDAHDFAIWSSSAPGSYYRVQIYRGGEGRLDEDADFTIKRTYDPDQGFGGIFLQKTDKPYDINGDGYSDLLTIIQAHNGEVTYDVFCGGEDFDTIPDLRLPTISGFPSFADFNGDGYDDLITINWRDNELLFLYGGEGPSLDSIAALSLNHFEGYAFTDCRACPDVNGDGYDDWVMEAYRENDPFSKIVWLFFGSDTLDAEADRTLQIDPTPLIGGTSNHGGFANADRYGDIITRQFDTRYFLGSNWVNESPGVILNASFYKTQGAYGDFNGDGTNDCVFLASDEPHYRRLLIYTNNPDWIVSIGDEGPYPIPRDFSAAAYPNPFNNQTIVTFQLPDRGDLNYSLIDIQGRTIESFERKILAPGAQSFVILGQGLPSGIYYLSAFLQSKHSAFNTTLKIIHIN